MKMQQKRQVIYGTQKEISEKNYQKREPIVGWIFATSKQKLLYEYITYCKKKS